MRQERVSAAYGVDNAGTQETVSDVLSAEVDRADKGPFEIRRRQRSRQTGEGLR